MPAAVLRAVLFSAALACAGCGTMQPAAPAPTASPTPAAAPSPRPDCAPASVTIYFADEVASDQPVAMPLLNDLMGHVQACEAAGGTLRGITIAATSDPGQSAQDAAEQVHRRQERVRNALVALGAPADKIHNGVAEHAAAVMGRRADISADLY